MRSRREFLHNLQLFCTLYGLQGILSHNSYAISNGPSRLINFVFKQTGGTTSGVDEGYWHFGDSLKPLAPYKNRITTVLGLDTKFNAPMDSHNAPQISALSGSMTRFVRVANILQNTTAGEGKSIDVLIGEKLQKQYKTSLPYILIGNSSTQSKSTTYGTSSWGEGGVAIPSITKVADLHNLVFHHLKCSGKTINQVDLKLNAIKYLEKNNSIIKSRNLIDKDKLELLKSSLSKVKENLTPSSGGVQIVCPDESKTLPLKAITNTRRNKDLLTKKMNYMFDLAIIALKFNLTRTLTFNLYHSDVHTTSHFSTNKTVMRKYLNWSIYYNELVASFVKRLEAENLLDDSLVYCNAGSSMVANVHNYSNLSTYIINGKKSGIVGSPANPQPIGSLLHDITNKFNLGFSQFGGSDHKYGIGKSLNYI